MRVLVNLLVLVSLAPGLVLAQAQPASRNPDYRWPLDVPPVLVSSFGEYRPMHLHGGLDLSTGGRSGLRCYAVADGWVARMRMSPFGYGKALYIQLDVGPLVVYAHLSRFAAEIADRAWAEQLRRGAFTFDIYLQRDELRVRRGDVVAWSGATGIGHPHLHFEVRDGDVARNPQTAGFALPDHVRPTIRDITLLPLSVDSHVEGDFQPLIVPAEQATPQRQPIRVAGSIGFAVRALDKAAEGPYHQAPYQYSVRVDGRLLYSAVHERFDYAHNHHSKLDYDQDRLVFDDQHSMQLFSRRGNRLQGRWPKADGRGVLLAGSRAVPASNHGDWFHLGPGTYDVEIEVVDVSGNQRSVRFPIRIDDVPQIERLQARHAESGWQAVCVARDDVGLASVSLSWKRPQDAEWNDLVSEIQRDQWTAAIPAAADEPFVLRAVAHDTGGLQALRTWGNVAPSARPDRPVSLEVHSSWRREHLSLTLQSPEWLNEMPQVQLEKDDGSLVPLRFWRQTGERQWTWRQAIGDLPAHPRRLLIQATTLDGVARVQEMPLEADIVRRGQATVVRGLVPGWEVEVEATTFFDDVAVRMQEFDSSTLPLGRELHDLGVAVSMESREAPTNRRIRVRYQPQGAVQDTLARRPRTALFSVDRSGNLQFLSAERDESGALVGRARYLSVFAVLEDTTAPRITQFRNRTRRGGEPRLEFHVSDAGADLDDGAVQVTIDDTLAIPEWDPETTRVTVHPTQPLSRGTHSMVVIVDDRVGNRSDSTWSFEIP